MTTVTELGLHDQIASAASLCASPPLTGSTTLTGVLNTYYPALTATLPADTAGTTVTVGSPRGAGTPLAVGDLVAIVQMQGVAINSANSGAYGDGVGGNPASGYLSNANFLAGLYEYATVTSVSGSTIGVAGAGASGGLLNTYRNADATTSVGQYRYQLIRVPQYASAAFNPATPPTALAWDGTSGGMVVLDVASTLDLNGATVDVSALGFAGGAQRVRGGAGGLSNTDYRTPTSSAANGQKGEGIAGRPEWSPGDPDSVGDGYPNGDFGRGAPANAGGGGTDGNPSDNDENSGGGGGGNGGTGGIGGNTWSSNLPRGGFGGSPVPGSVSRVFLGGGGGAGSDNNNVDISAGGAGGGAVLIRAGSLTGTGTINANGEVGGTSGQDGAGGAGAGGSVVVLTSATGAASGIGGLTVNARGGHGGDETNSSAHGPGGGGGGGRVILSSTASGVSVAGGTNGEHNGSPYGATSGTNGSSTTATISSSPGTNTGSQCIDVNVTKTISPTEVVPGQPVTYTITVTNAGPYPATGTAPVSVTDTLPADLVSPTWTCAASVGSSCATAAGSGSLATSANLTVGGSAVYTVTGTLSGSFTGTLSNTATVAGPASVPELNTADNTDTVEATTALGVLMDKSSDVSGPLYDGDLVTYTITLENQSANPIAGVEVTDVLPPGLVYEAESTVVEIPSTVVTETTVFTDTFGGGFGDWHDDDNDDGNDDVNVTNSPISGSQSLHIQDDDTGAWRALGDLSGYFEADFNFDYVRSSIENGEYLRIYARADVTGESTTNANCSTDGNWDVIGTIAAPPNNDLTVQSTTISIPASYLTANPGICFFTPDFLSNNDDFYIDNTQVVARAMTDVTVTRNNDTTAPSIPPLVAGTPDALVVAGDLLTLPAGATMTITYQARVDASAVPNGGTTLTNAATFDAPTYPGEETASVTDPLAVADLSVRKTDDGPVAPGEQITYTITVANAGPQDAVDTIVTDTLDANVTVDSVTSSQGGCTALPCDLGTVPNDGTATVTVVVTVGAGAPTGSTLEADATEPGLGDCTGADVCNVAAASSDALDWTTANDADDEPTDVTPPVLAVDKPAPVLSIDADGSGDISAGDTLTYTITATNPNAISLTNVVVADGLISPTGGTTPCASVAPGGTCTLIGTHVVTPGDVAAGSILNTATADSDQTDTAMDDETTALLAPALSVDKPAPVLTDADGSGDVSAGDTLTYTITATNSGAANLTDVVVADVRLTPTGGTTPCALLAPGATCTLVGTYVVTPGDVAAGSIVNEASADSDQTDPVTDDETTAVLSPELSVNKPAPVLTNDADGSGDLSVGDTLTYTITATNSGTANLTDVVVSDDLIAPTGGSTPCALVAPGGTCTLVGTHVVTSGDVAAGSIVNEAEADSDQTGPVTDGETTPVPSPGLSVDKPAPVLTDDADGSGDISAGDTLTYTITATNTDTASLTDVVVADDRITPTGGTTPCALVLPGATCTLIGTYLVVPGDVTAGSIVNEATADSDQTIEVSDDETTLLPSPDLGVDKPAPVLTDDADGSGDISAGDTLTYTITATNSGTANLTDVVVSDDMITPTGGSTPCALVAPGGTCTLVGTYVVTPGDVVAGEIVNEGEADSDQTDPVTDGETTAVLSPVLSVDKPAPVLTDDADGSGDISVGDTLTYTITATNSGTANLTDVVVSDDLIAPTGGSTPCALVAPGGTCTLVGTYVVTPGDVVAGEIVNEGEADSDQTDPVTDGETTAVWSPVLSVDKPAPVLTDDADGSGDISAGDTLTYTITATNSGAANLTDVALSDVLITPTGGSTPCALVAPAGTCTLVGTHLVTPADVAAGEIVNEAEADSDQTDPVTDGETTSLLAPALSVVKPAPVLSDDADGSGDISAGDTLTYTITATNSGTANLTDVVVSDDMITATGGSTPCALVAPGGTCTLVGTHLVTPGDVAAGEIVNEATADSDQTDPVSDDETTAVLTPDLGVDKPAPVLTDDADGSGDISAGDTLTYTITATNSGAANLTDVVVSDDLITPTGGTTPCALVAPAGTCTLVGTYLVTPADVAAGEIVNEAEADSDQTDPVTDDETTVLASPALSVDKPAPVLTDDADGSGDVSVGDTLTYTITATNSGTANLTDVVVSDDLITPTGGTTPCALVAPGGTCTLIGTYLVTPADVTAGEIVNEATADSDQTDPVTDDETTVLASPGLSVDKPAPVLSDDADGSGDISVGDTLTYTITATNDGTSTLTGVVVTDDMISSTGGTTPCGVVLPGATCTLIGTYEVAPADVTAGSIVNEASADSDQTAVVTDDETTPVLTPGLALDKAAPVLTTDADGSGDISVGDTLTYTITATNSGTANLTDVVVSDDMITPTGGTTPCALVAPGGTCTLVGTYLVAPGDVVTGEIVNEATAVSDQTGPESDIETTPLSAPALSVDKPAPVLSDDADGSGDISVGDTLTYTITATNSGTANLTDVDVTDDLITPTGGTTPCALVAPGGTCTLVGAYLVTPGDVVAGEIVNEATADSDQTDPVTDDETTVLLAPALSVDKPAPVLTDADGSGDISAGDTLTYTITATNSGAANLTGVVVSDDLITPTGGSTPCALVAPGGTCTLVGTYVVTPGDVAAGSIVNEAEAESDQTDPVTDDETTVLLAPALSVDKPAPVLTDDADGSGDISAGDTLTYTITATNSGTAALTDVVVSDDMITPTAGSTPCALLAPGGTCTLVGTYAVTPGDVATGSIVNEATADSDQTDPVTDDETTAVPTPGLSVDKPAPVLTDDADGSGDISAGDTLTYTITATNSGAANLTGVVVSDDMITPTGGTTPCALVAPGGTCTLVGTYLVTPGDATTGSIVNEATAGSDQVGPVTDDEITPLLSPGLSVVKPAPVLTDDADGSGDISVGDTLTYTITATNTGGAALTDVVVSDGLITPTGGTTPCALVPSGGTCTLVGTYVVTPGDVTAGEIVNEATADSDQTDPETDGETTAVPAPDLSVDKPAPVLTDDADGSGDISAGDTLTYTITATNSGTAALTDVVVTDDRITPTGGTTPCALVAPGGTCTLVGTYLVTPADVTAGEIVNEATADSDQTDPVTDDETTAVPAPELSVDKPAPVLTDDADGSGDVSAGDTLTYTITATNSGTANLTGVVVTDDMITPTGGTTPCALLAPGATCTLIGTYVVTPADVTAGEIVNEATAESDQTDPVTDDETTVLASPGLSVDKPAPVISDDADGSGDVSAGDTLTYTITATNDGTSTLTGVVVTDDMITPTGGTTPCGVVLPGGTCTLIGTYLVTPADVATGEIVNEATADSDQTDAVTDDETTAVPAPDLSVDKPAPVLTDDADGSGDVSAGDTLTYTITATNSGAASLTDVIVTDDLISPTGGTTPCALVAPGGTCTLVGTYLVTSTDVTTGTIANEATADSDQTGEVTDDVTVSVPTPVLSIDKPDPVNADEDGSGDVSVGDTLTYTVTATNSGAANLTDVVVSDGLITPTGGTTPCALLAPGGTCTLVGTHVVVPGDITTGSISNTASAVSDQTTPVIDTNVVSAPSPEIALVKAAPTNADEDGSGDVSVGDTLTYTITMTNTGGATLTDVIVSDDMITPTGGTTPCLSVAPAGTCTLIGTYVVVPSDVTATEIVNTATVSSDQTPDVMTQRVTPVPAPALSVDKPAPVNADEDGSGDVSVGDTLTYTITASNVGTSVLTGVTISDDLITPTGGTTPCGSLAPGDDCTLVGTYVVTPGDVTAGSIVNTAVADSDQTGPATDGETTAVPTPVLSVDKPAPVLTDDADGSGDISAGDTLTYTITATNAGTANLTGVVVTDDLITSTGGTTPCALVAPGDTCTLVGTYLVTPGDVTVGSIVNEATADSDQTGPVTDDETTLLPTPSLNVAKPAPVNDDADGSGDVSVGDTLTYTITATNTGVSTLTDLTVVDDLITSTGGTAPCASVLPGGTCTLIGTYVVTPADVATGSILNTATADSDQTPSTTDANTVAVPRPDLSVSKPAPVNDDADGSGDVSVGDTLTYTITATNTGSATLTGVVVADDTITPTGGTTPCGPLAPGGTCTLIGTHLVEPADAASGSIVNIATASSDQTEPVTDTVTVPVPLAALAVVKPAPVNDDADGSGDVSVGDTLTYTITATNVGGANLTDVVVDDDMITPTGGTTPCALVATGGTCTLVGTYLVTPADVTATQIVNGATADSVQTAPVADDETTPVPTPALVVDKPAPALTVDADGSGDVSVGDTLTYTITATNVGTANLTDVVVSDDLITPTAGTTPCALVVPGGSCTLIGTYEVLPANLVDGSIVNEATADSTQTPAVTDDEITPTPSPELAVAKPAPTNADEDGSGDISVGDTLTYTITATNTGDANLTNVVVSDDLITPTGGSTPCATLAPGETCTLTGTYAVTPADVTTGEIENTATAVSDQTTPSTGAVTVPVPSPALTIVKPAPANADEDGSGDVSVGDTLTYTITATNTGGANLTNVVVSDDLITPTGGSTPCAFAAPGDSCTLTGTHVVSPDDLAGGTIVNIATGTSDQAPTVTDSVTVVAPIPDIVVVKAAPVNADEDGSGDISAGDTLTYTITATNTGGANLTNVVVSDGLITPTGGTTPCALVAPGDTCILVGTTVVTPGDVVSGEIVNDATVTSDQTPDGTTQRVTPLPDPVLSIDKPAPTNADEDGSGDVSVGDTLTYTITATNTGTATLTDVVVTDDLITPTGGTTPCGVVMPGGTCTLIGTSVVTPADVAAGVVTNIATADSDQTTPVTDTQNTPAPTPALSVDKPAPVNADEDGSGDVSAGDTLTYTITATNTGAATLTGVVITDDLITPTGGTTPCATLAPGETCTLVGTLVVTSGDVLAGEIVNTATADSVQTPPTTDDHVQSVGQPELALDKPAPVNADEDGSGDVSVGDTLTYTITATNLGAATLTNVTIDDPMLTVTGGSAPCAILETGETCTLVGTYVVTDDDVDTGRIDNVATTDSDQIGPVEADDSTLVPEPAMTIVKPLPTNTDQDGSGTITIGDTLVYTITATNSGTANLTDVVIDDPTIEVTGGSSPCALLAPGETCTLIGIYVVTADDLIAGQVDNTATATSDQTASVIDSVSVDVVTAPVGSISGSVWADADGDGVFDAAEESLAGIRIVLVGAGPDGLFDTADDSIRSVTTTALYTFDGLPLNELYRISIDLDTLPDSVGLPTYDLDLVLDDETTVRLTAANPDLVAVDFGYDAPTIPFTGGDPAPTMRLAFLLSALGVAFIVGARRRGVAR